jgi:osmotically-inducible protein OsmY
MVHTDIDVQTDVTDELRWEPMVDAANIGVSADRGAVTLSGHVASYAEKLAAEKAAKRVKGVTAVANELKVRLPRHNVIDDADIALSVSQAMAATISLPRGAVQATVRDGWVTLEGTVTWDYQRGVAARIAHDARGVVGVINLINLQDTRLAHDIERDIRAALHRRADVDAHALHVSARNGRVTLTGTVTSWSEVTAARRAAASAPGVKQVDTNVRVQPLRDTASV